MNKKLLPLGFAILVVIALAPVGCGPPDAIPIEEGPLEEEWQPYGFPPLDQYPLVYEAMGVAEHIFAQAAKTCETGARGTITIDEEHNCTAEVFMARYFINNQGQCTQHEDVQRVFVTGRVSEIGAINFLCLFDTYPASAGITLDRESGAIFKLPTPEEGFDTAHIILLDKNKVPMLKIDLLQIEK